MRPEGLLAVGRLTRPHGLAGELVAQLTTNRSERLAPGSVLYTEARQLVVSSSRPMDKNFLVRFDGIVTREGADELAGETLFAEPLADPDELWVHELIGGTVVDGGGVERGVVEAVEANPASDLLVLDSGSLVPLRFVTNFSDGLITVDVPPGLFEL